MKTVCVPLRIYVAGKYTADTPEEVKRNVSTAFLYGNLILDKGHIPYVPHYTHYLHLQKDRPPDFWYKLDLNWLRLCDAIFMIPNFWAESKGAKIEFEFAEKLGLWVFHHVVEIPEVKLSDNHDRLLKHIDEFNGKRRRRTIQGANKYGSDFLTKDNLAEARDEIADTLNYIDYQVEQLRK